jgi:glycosyltransferase involved in cell wall biosynthesis
MKVGLNLLYLFEGSAGAGRYGFELLSALRRVEPETRVVAFIGADAAPALLEQPWSGEVEWVRLPVRVSNRSHLLGQMALLPLLAARRGVDVLHSPANVGPAVAPRAARVVTLLDLIWLHEREAWDPSRAGRGMAALSRFSATRADRVLAISEAARDDFVQTLRLDPGRVDVTPLGVREPSGGVADPERELRRRHELGNAPVVLCVAQKRPYKNLVRLVRSVPELPEAVLVLVGSPTAYESELKALAAELQVERRVRFLGWVSERELEGLYALARCFVLPSLIEGFGLPVLEAMARDVPVACSNRGALPEVAGDAALLFDPEDQTALTNALRRLLADTRLGESLVRRGRERVRLFTWERTAETTLASYRRAIGSV